MDGISENIVDQSFNEAFAKNTLNYAIEVISDRAIPSYEDGLKPVQRRILWLMYSAKMFPNGPTKKSIRVVGDVLGRYHPHGDGSVYSALVNLTNAYMLEEYIATQGNFGIRKEEDAAAARYTECKLSEKSLKYLLNDLDEDCVDFKSNFDETLLEPVVLPSKLPMLLVNGSSGIAVGLATNIPSHSVSEVAQICLDFIDGNEQDAYEHFVGPDWKSRGCLYLDDENKKSIFEEGRGQVFVYGKCEKVYKTKNTKYNELRVYELPWMTSRQELIDEVVNKVKDEFNDLNIFRSSKPGEPIVRLQTKGDIDRLEDLLYLKTKFATTYTYNLVFLDGKIPCLQGVRDVVKKWIEFRRKVVMKRFSLKLAKAQKELKYVQIRKLLHTQHLDEFLTILRKDGKASGEEFLKTTLHAEEDQIDRLMRVQIGTLSKDSLLELDTTIEKLTSDIDQYTKHSSTVSGADEYIKAELKELIEEQGEDARFTEVLENKIVVGSKLNELVTRKFSVSNQNIVVGTGVRKFGNEYCVVLTNKEIFRIKFAELNKYRDGAVVDPRVLRKGVKGETDSIDFDSKYVCLIFENGECYTIDLGRVKRSNKIVTFKNQSKLKFVCYLNDFDGKSFVTVGKDEKISTIKLLDVSVKGSRSLQKKRIRTVPLREAYVFSSDKKIKISFDGRGNRLLMIDELPNTRRGKALSTKKIQNIELYEEEAVEQQQNDEDLSDV